MTKHDYDMMRNVIRIHNAVADNPAQSASLRILKLSEEVGEVADKYIQYIGANNRKQIRRPVSRTDVALEIADVAVTALVALMDFTTDPVEFLESHLMMIAERTEKEGS